MIESINFLSADQRVQGKKWKRKVQPSSRSSGETTSSFSFDQTNNFAIFRWEQPGAMAPLQPLATPSKEQQVPSEKPSPRSRKLRLGSSSATSPRCGPPPFSDRFHCLDCEVIIIATMIWIRAGSWIFESLFQRWILKAPLSAFCIVNAAADVLDG